MIVMRREEKFDGMRKSFILIKTHIARLLFYIFENYGMKLAYRVVLVLNYSCKNPAKSMT